VNYVESPKREKTTKREREVPPCHWWLHMVLCIQVNVIPPCWNRSPIYTSHVKYIRPENSAQFEHLSSLSRQPFELNTLAWVDIGETPSLSMVCAWLQIRVNCTRKVTASFEWELGLEIEISVIGYDFSSNYSTRSKFELQEGNGLDVWKLPHIAHPSEAR